MEKKSDLGGWLIDKGFEGSTPEEWKEHSLKRLRLLQGVTGGMNVLGGGLMGTGVGMMHGNPLLGAGIGAGAGGLMGLLPISQLQAARNQLSEDPKMLRASFKLHKERQAKKQEEKKASAFDQGYSDALAKLGYDSRKLSKINKGGAAITNPKATAGGTAAQPVLPKAGRGTVNKSDAGF